MPWFIKTKDGKRGPISSKKLKGYAAAGKLMTRTPIRRVGKSAWVLAGSIEGLFSERPPKADEIPRDPEPSVATLGISTMPFIRRAPSTAWEAVPLPTKPPIVIWSWFKPAAAPNSVVLQLPPELWKSDVSAEQLTLRLMADAAGVDSLIGWTLFGQAMPFNNEVTNWLDAKLPASQAGGDQQLILWSQPIVLPGSASPASEGSANAAPNPELLISRGEAASNCPAKTRLLAAWDRLSDTDRLRLIAEAERLADGPAWHRPKS